MVKQKKKVVNRISSKLTDKIKKIQQLHDIANILRRDSLLMTTQAGSGHPSSCLSCAEIISVLFFNEMHYDPKEPHAIENDEFILSKGHAAPILYSALKRNHMLHESLKNFRTQKGHIEGHPMPSKEEPWIKVASGSLGQGLSVGLGMSLAQKIKKSNARTYVLLGDSEVAEGSVYEACELAAYYQVKNLIAILDLNRLGQRGETMLGHDDKAYTKRFRGFGWNVIIAEGHSISSLLNAFSKIKDSNAPTIILAKTIKGKGVSFMEDKMGWHGKALSKEELEQALKEIPFSPFPEIKPNIPKRFKSKKSAIKKIKVPSLNFNLDISTRQAYGHALEELSNVEDNIIVLDAEVSNSTFSELIKKVHSEKFIESFVAEQNMIGMAQGLSLKGYHVYASSFAAFLSRAHDQLRMASYSNTNMTLCGSHAGISIGQDGASQMGLEDIAMFRDISKSIIFYPSDAISTEKLVHLANKVKGMKYIRTTRATTPVIYDKKEEFDLGDFKVLRKSEHDSVVLIGSGITLHECLKAYEKLKEHHIHAAVIDLYCIQPLNIHKLANFIKNHGNKMIIAEDHYSAGGIGEMLSHELMNTGIRMKTLSVHRVPHSGTPQELLEKYGINARHIAMHARTFV